MRMNRRNVLVGLGTIVAGGGAALGTGAFSSVEAERTVDLDTTGDSSALLALESESSIVSYDGGDGDDSGEIEFDEDSLNENATTTFDPAFTVENNGGEHVGFYVEDGDDLGDGELLDFTHEGDSIVQSDAEDGNQVDLAEGSDAVEIGVVVDTTEGEIGDIENVTLVASRDAYDK